MITVFVSYTISKPIFLQISSFLYTEKTVGAISKELRDNAFQQGYLKEHQTILGINTIT